MDKTGLSIQKGYPWNRPLTSKLFQSHGSRDTFYAQIGPTFRLHGAINSSCLQNCFKRSVVNVTVFLDSLQHYGENVRRAAKKLVTFSMTNILTPQTIRVAYIYTISHCEPRQLSVR